MKLKAIIAVILAAWMLHPPRQAQAQQPPAADVAAGLELSRRICARCHAIDPAKPWDSIGSTPSFKLMAGKIEDYEPRLRSVTARRPHTGQEMSLSLSEIEKIIAYIQSLITDE